MLVAYMQTSILDIFLCFFRNNGRS